MNNDNLPAWLVSRRENPLSKEVDRHSIPLMTPRELLISRIPQSDTFVKLRGEPLDKVVWQGRQWAVTKYGLECRDGLYSISKEQLDKQGDGLLVDVIGKNWVDAADFAVAYTIARVFRRLKNALDS